jgi:hypothetical protein
VTPLVRWTDLENERRSRIAANIAKAVNAELVVRFGPNAGNLTPELVDLFYYGHTALPGRAAHLVEEAAFQNGIAYVPGGTRRPVQRALIVPAFFLLILGLVGLATPLPFSLNPLWVLIVGMFLLATCVVAEVFNV